VLASSHSDSAIEATEVAEELSRGRIRGTLVAFEIPNFRILWAGRATSNMARQMRVFLRAWIVWDITGSPFLLGFVTSSLAWPMLFMPFLGGFLADKFDRRRLVKITESLLVVLWATVAALVYFDVIVWWHFIISSVLSGVIQSIGRPGHQALLGSIVDKKRLANATALDNAADAWPRVAGPALGAILIGAIGVGWLFWITAFGQLFTAITLFLLDWDPVEQRAKQRSKGHSSSFTAGFKYIWQEKVLLGLVGLGVSFAMIGGAAMFMLPIFADALLGVGASGLGYLMTVSTIGGSVGAVVVVAMSNFKYRGYLLMVVAVINTVVLIAFSRSDIFLVSIFLIFGMGMAQVLFRTMRLVAMQVLAPDDLRGRVMSFQTTIQGMSWIGVLIMGAIAEFLSREAGFNVGGLFHLGGGISRGVADTLLISGIAYGVISMIFFATFPALRKFR
jgi:MFS family permease